MYHRLVLIFLFISILHALNTNNNEDFLERIKRFLMKKKTTTTTTKKPNSDSISALITTTSSSIYSDKYGQTRSTSLPIKPACDGNNPCQNGGTCKTLPSGRHYCYCTEQYYGRNCEKKFKYTGYEKNVKLSKDSCSSSPCGNLGKCISSGKTYSCQCKTPYYGTNCDKRLSKREEYIFENLIK